MLNAYGQQLFMLNAILGAKWEEHPLDKSPIEEADVIAAKVKRVSWPVSVRSYVKGMGTCIGLTSGVSGVRVYPHPKDVCQVARRVNAALPLGRSTCSEGVWLYIPADEREHVFGMALRPQERRALVAAHCGGSPGW